MLALRPFICHCFVSATDCRTFHDPQGSVPLNIIAKGIKTQVSVLTGIPIKSVERSTPTPTSTFDIDADTDIDTDTDTDTDIDTGQKPKMMVNFDRDSST